MPDESDRDHDTLRAHTLEHLPADLSGGVVAIGNFDGVHRAHARLIDFVIAEARGRGVRAVVLTFEPHPRTFFRPQTPVFRLTPPAMKARLLKVVGVDGLVVLPFDRTLSETSAEDFIGRVLVGGLAASVVVVGYDFHFGKGRAGNQAMLESAGAEFGFAVSTVPAIVDQDGSLISSSVIRDALAAGDIAAANRLLGYRWFVSGTVIPGDRRGRELGFPTANMRLPAESRLRHGIYAVRFTRGGATFDGVASYGRRPTFDNGAPLLETFLFDFSGDLYGAECTVTFLDWIRPEERFPSVDALVAAMDKDYRAAREALAAAGPGTAIDRALGGAA